MKCLHVACLPFPSPQGTQALLGAQLRCLGRAGHDVHLLSYESGEGDPPTLFTHHRCGGAEVGLRSGPSTAKVFGDVAMIKRVRSLCDSLQPDVLFAHNVEAAWVTRAARVSAPLVYVAHTRMDTELPTYFRPGLASAARMAGRVLDGVAARADHIATVSPALANHLGGTYLPPPWPLPPAITSEERKRARDALGVSGLVALYAGNLDGYQDWQQIFAAREHGMTLVVATESDPRALGGVRHVLRLRDEVDRRRAHALADIAVVPRGADGGLPIKLIDALSRGVPVAASEHALAGLRPDGVFHGRDVAAALCSASLDELSALGLAGRAWTAEHTSPARFADAIERVARIAIDSKTRSVGAAH